jgi:hypothetical protein
MVTKRDVLLASSRLSSLRDKMSRPGKANVGFPYRLPELQGNRVAGKEAVKEGLALLLAGILIATRGFL